MGFFISYSRRDERAVRVLANDLERTRNSTWMDRELGGGEDWWQEILRQVREADVFVLAVSNHSLHSRPCLAELEYATALGVPVLPVQIGDVDSYRTTPVAEKQVIDYRRRAGADQAVLMLTQPAIDVVVAAVDLASRRRRLPDPLPAAPPIPFEYLMQIRLAVDAPEIPSRIQLQVLTQLKQALREEDDAAARRDVIDLLLRLRRHPDTTYRNAVELDELLAHVDGSVDPGDPPPSDEPPSWRPDVKTPREWPSEAVVDPGPEPAGRPPVTSTSSTRADGAWSALAIGLGALGLGQLVILVGVAGPSVAAIVAAEIVILALTLVGVAVSVGAVRRKQWLARPALTISLLGSAAVLAALLAILSVS